jgi:hypothetical protein
LNRWTVVLADYRRFEVEADVMSIGQGGVLQLCQANPTMRDWQVFATWAPGEWRSCRHVDFKVDDR